jgi:hypothetical protein
MPNGNRIHTWRAALFMLVIASIFWLGSSIVRAVVGNSLLQIGTLNFDEYISPDAEREIYTLIAEINLVVIISYAVAVVSSIVFLKTMPFRLKEHGWLMMSAILFYLFVPVELFTMTIDAEMIYLHYFTTAGQYTFRELFIARVAALSGTPLIGTLCYFTIIALAVFQPFRKPAAAS